MDIIFNIKIIKIINWSLSDKIDLKRSHNYVSFSNLSAYYTWKNVKSEYKNNKFKMLTPVFKNLFFKSIIEIKSTSNNLCSSFWYCGRSRHQKCSIKTVYLKFCKICTSNHMFKRETWDKFTELTFLKFWNLPSETSEISKFQKMSEVNFPQISRINVIPG